MRVEILKSLASVAAVEKWKFGACDKLSFAKAVSDLQAGVQGHKSREQQGRKLSPGLPDGRVRLLSLAEGSVRLMLVRDKLGHSQSVFNLARPTGGCG